jgi:DNA repair exonuclease SbcCD ATPase subunit
MGEIGLHEKVERRLTKATDRRRRAVAKAIADGVCADDMNAMLTEFKEQADSAEAALKQAQSSEVHAHEAARQSRARLDKAHGSLATLQRLREQLSQRQAESRAAQESSRIADAALSDELLADLRQRADAVSASLERSAREKRVQVERRQELRTRSAALLQQEESARSTAAAAAAAARARSDTLRRDVESAQAAVETTAACLDEPHRALQEEDAAVRDALDDSVSRFSTVQEQLSGMSAALSSAKEDMDKAARRLEAGRRAKDTAVAAAQSARQDLRSAKEERQSARGEYRASSAQRDKMRAVRAALRKDMGLRDSDKEEDEAGEAGEAEGEEPGSADTRGAEVGTVGTE